MKIRAGAGRNGAEAAAALWLGFALRCGLVSAAQAKNLPGRLKTDLLTELLDVAAVQAA